MAPPCKRTAVLFITGVGLAGLLVLVAAGLPWFAEKVVLPRIAAAYDLSQVSCQVRRIGLRGADLGDLIIGDADRPALQVSAVQVDYSLAGLWRGHLKSVSVSGLVLRGQLRNGAFSLSGVDWQTLRAPVPAATPRAGTPAADAMPISFGRLDIVGSRIDLEIDGADFRLPFALHQLALDGKRQTLTGEFDLYPLAQHLGGTFFLDLDRQIGRVTLAAERLSLPHLAGGIAAGDALQVKGAGSMQGEIELSLAPVEIKSASVTAFFKDFAGAYKDIRVSGDDDTRPGAERGLRLVLSKEEHQPWRVSGPVLAVGDRPWLRLEPLEFRLGAGGGKWRFSGELEASFPLPDAYSSKEGKPFRTSGLASRLEVVWDGAQHLDFTLRAGGKDPQGQVAIPLEGEMVLLSQPLVQVTGRLGPENAGGGLGGNLEIAINGAACELPGLGVELSGIKGRMPLSLSRPDSGKNGSLTIQEIRFQGRSLGLLEASITRDPSGLSFAGRAENSLWPALPLAFSGKSGFAGGFRTTVQVTGKGTGDFDLGKIADSARGILIAGEASLEAEVHAAGRETSARVGMTLQHGTLRMKEYGLEVDGLSLGLSFPDALRLESAPRQVLTFESASLGDLAFQNGEVHFQLEAGPTLFVEEARFQWCGGNIFAQPFRVAGNSRKFGATLFCDRVNLARMLGQFGIASATGEGSLNGRIPFYVDRGKFGVEDGFLYSTPGTGGTIQMTDTKGFAGGIPAGSPEWSQMALAREALKDFDYNWATLKLTSKGEALYLRLSVDGKPARVLPFVYRRESGAFEPAEKGHPGSRFQGIRLDVNFNLPLNTLLQYKGIMSELP